MATVFTNASKSGVVSELWSLAYEPWLVSEQPWLNEDTTAGTPWENLNKS